MTTTSVINVLLATQETDVKDVPLVTTGIQQKLVDPVGHVPVGVILMGETLGAVTGRQGSA